jgi:hypothetical protein
LAETGPFPQDSQPSAENGGCRAHTESVCYFYPVSIPEPKRSPHGDFCTPG